MLHEWLDSRLFMSSSVGGERRGVVRSDLLGLEGVHLTLDTMPRGTGGVSKQ